MKKKSLILYQKYVWLYDFFVNPYNNTDVYNEYGLGVYFRDTVSGDIKTTHVPAPIVP